MKWNEKINIDEHKVFFTSDWHLFHTNILKMNNRPFDDVEQMYQHILAQVDSELTDNDYLFILGDVLWGSQDTKLKNLADRLHCKVCIVLGNHDKQNQVSEEYPDGRNFSYFFSVSRADYITVHSTLHNINQEIYLSHYPALTWPNKGRGSWHLHGHTHGNIDTFNSSNYDLRVDVGLDAEISQMKILSFEDIQEYFLNKTNGEHNFCKYMQQIYADNKTLK